MNKESDSHVASSDLTWDFTFYNEDLFLLRCPWGLNYWATVLPYLLSWVT